MQVAGTSYRYNEPYTLVALIFLPMSYPVSLLFRNLNARAVLNRDRAGVRARQSPSPRKRQSRFGDHTETALM
jgi:hypothetical protein